MDDLPPRPHRLLPAPNQNQPRRNPQHLPHYLRQSPSPYLDEVIANGTTRDEEASALSTLLNDSLYIIRLNLLEEDAPPKNEQPLEIMIKSTDGYSVFLNSVRNSFILGVEVESKNEGPTHKLIANILKHVSDEMEDVVELMEEEANNPY